MRVDPKQLRGFHEVTLSFILVVGAGGLIGAASVSSLWKRPSSVETVPVAGAGSIASNEPVNDNEVSSSLPDEGARVAVFLSLEKRSSMLLFSDVPVLKGRGGEKNLEITEDQRRILKFAKSHGALTYRVIPAGEVSPYSGQDVDHIEDLEHIIGH